MLLAQVVQASAEVATTRSRNAKMATIAAVLARLDGAEIRPATALLAGELPGGRAGVGWSTLASVRAEPASQPALSISSVAEEIDRIRSTTGTGSTRRRAEALRNLLRAATELEQEFLIRLLGGELRQGALEGVMLESIAKAADVRAEAVRRALMLSGGLQETAAAALSGGEVALARFRIEVGRPVRPMLASPGETLEAAVLEQQPVVVEYKLDGARIQVHREGEDVQVYTRTLRDITEQVPELVELVRDVDCRSVVLDGETLALGDSGRPRSFQETMGRFGAKSSRDLLLRPYFFDCLHLDGTDLLDLPLSQRQEALRRVVAPEVRVPSAVDPSTAEAADLLADALAAGHEGVVVKSLDSVYAAGRRGQAWRKVKPSHTLDLVVLAAEWGHGRRAGYLSNLHLGARDPDGAAPVMVGKTFKGLTDELLEWQTREFQRRQYVPQGDAGVADSDPDMAGSEWVVPVTPDLVVEIELDGVQVSSRYPGGVALRFARVVRYRPDRDAASADTIDAVRAMLPRST